MRVAVDTNIIVYAEGLDDQARHDTAIACLFRLRPPMRVVPLQVLGEAFRVLCRKGRWPRARARDAVLKWYRDSIIVPTNNSAFAAALDLACAHQLDIWDAVILAVAEEAGCRLLLSEDFQDGFSWRGITAVNPFAAKPHPLLADVLGES